MVKSRRFWLFFVGIFFLTLGSFSITKKSSDASVHIYSRTVDQGITISQNGDLGICVTSPMQALHVSGNGIITGYITANTYYGNGSNLTGLTAPAAPLPIATTYWPDFDAGAPYLIYGALWVGWDATAQTWKYNKQNGATAPRGLTDPGNPNTWTVNGSTIGTFDGDLSSLPSGTHINNRYHPKMVAYRCAQDDIQVKIGPLWVDKYANRILDVGSSYSGSTLKDDSVSDATIMQSSANASVPPYWMAFSQKAQCSTGMTWFVAQKAATNAGKRLIANEEWQAADAGTARSDATGNPANGNSWASVADQDVSAYGVVGMAGNVWEWVSTWWTGTSTVSSGQAEAAAYGGDYTYGIAKAANQGNSSYLPAALLRGGGWSYGALVGVFALNAGGAPSCWDSSFGFRSVR